MTAARMLRDQPIRRVVLIAMVTVLMMALMLVPANLVRARMAVHLSIATVIQSPMLRMRVPTKQVYPL